MMYESSAFETLSFDISGKKDMILFSKQTGECYDRCKHLKGCPIKDTFSTV